MMMNSLSLNHFYGFTANYVRGEKRVCVGRRSPLNTQRARMHGANSVLQDAFSRNRPFSALNLHRIFIISKLNVSVTCTQSYTNYALLFKKKKQNKKKKLLFFVVFIL